MKQSFFVISITFLFLLTMATQVQAQTDAWWSFQAVDTMKFSRDVSREFLSDRPRFRKIAEQQVKDIAGTGATHVAIATPYDEEFVPILREWVELARKYNLKVWFRGNWSGWEGWFGYPKITRAEHITKSVNFITEHPDLFMEGDFFSACPECENGGPGDPRMNGDAQGHRQFLIDEHNAVAAAFRQIGKGVRSNLNSMNGDVAKLIMDKETTAALGGVVVVDHYVRSPNQLNKDITEYAERSGGKVILGEFGAPIPDIHGNMTEVQQAAWLETTLRLLAANPALEGLSYWTNVGGSTAIWKDDQPTQAVDVLRKYFSPQKLTGKINNTIGRPIDAEVQTKFKTIRSDDAGRFELLYLDDSEVATISATGYYSQERPVSELVSNSTITLTPEKPSWWYKLQLWVRQLLT